jgi:hypothetical protein
MKKLTLARVVPTIVANISWLTLGITPCLPHRAKSKQDSGEPFFAGIEKLIHQVFQDVTVPGQQMIDENVAECILLMKRPYHLFSFNPE